MPNIKQQKKRVRQATRQRVENLRWRSTAKTLMRRLREAADCGAELARAEVLRLSERLLRRERMHLQARRGVPRTNSLVGECLARANAADVVHEQADEARQLDRTRTIGALQPRLGGGK